MFRGTGQLYRVGFKVRSGLVWLAELRSSRTSLG